MILPDRIKLIIARHPDIKVNVATLNDDTHLRDHLGADDLVRLDLSMEVEEAFGVVFPDDEFGFNTIGELIALTERALAAKEKAA